MKIRKAASSMSLTPVNSCRITDKQQFSFISVTIYYNVKIIFMMSSSLSQLNILNCRIFVIWLQWCRRAVVARCRWRLKLSSSRVHLTSTASLAAVPSHILGVLKLPPDNASTSVYSTLLPPCPRHVTESRVDNMATCWRSWTRGTCQCVLEVELSYVRLTSSFHNQTTFTSFRHQSANENTWSN